MSRPTMADVARRCGVSAMTVSYCYNQPDRVAPETLRRVREVAAERGRPASADGYIVWTTVDGDPVLDVVSGLGKPVAIHGGPAFAGARVVTIDNRASARELAARTFAGARRPGVLSFPFDRDRRPRLETGPAPEEAVFPVTRERLLGIYDHLGDLGGLPVAVVARNDSA